LASSALELLIIEILGYKACNSKDRLVSLLEPVICMWDSNKVLDGPDRCNFKLDGFKKIVQI
ncbi:MAG: hypothetical protein KJO63_12865, partial [Maribacter sp.]|nr:hypothetical protein [Maribacter sp.]